MAVCKCKMCGGDLNITELDKVAVCDYCGTQQTVPGADSEKKLSLFNRANRLRLNSEFDAAAALYEQIAAEFPEEAEAYWGLCLCRYGIEYVTDPSTGEKKPTCHRASFEKLTADENCVLAMEYADISAKRLYRREAQEIDRINEEILSVSKNESPYDVFICYKETDDAGGRTPDSVMAQDIYDALTGKGYKVFFARISLEDKLGLQYEPYIFAALNSAKIMLSVGTMYEYFHAVWVKNEWSRFLRLAAKDKSKILIPCYKDMDPYDMPDEFKGLQAQDLGKLGAVQDLVRGVEKLLAKDAAAAQPAPAQVVVANPSGATTDSLLDRAFLFLEDGEWQSANEYAEKVLDIDPRCGEAYLVKAMADLQVKNRDGLADCPGLEKNANTAKALRFGNESLKNEVEGYISSTKEAEEARRKAREEEEQKKKEEEEARRKACEEEEKRRKEAEEAARKAAIAELTPVRQQIAPVQHLLAAGSEHTVGLKKDGTVVAVGSNVFGRCEVSGWRDIVAIAAGYHHTVGLKKDGTVVATKYTADQKYYDGQCDVSGWRDIVAIAAEDDHTVGLKKDGTVITVGRTYSEHWVYGWRDIVAVAAGRSHTVGLKKDGTVIATGSGLYGQLAVTGWRDIVAVAAGSSYTVGLKKDGTVVATKYTYDQKYNYGQCDVSGWRDIVAIAAGKSHTVGLKKDGTVVATKYTGDQKNYYGQCDVSGWRDIVALGAGSVYTVGLKKDGTIVATKITDPVVRDWKLFDDYRTYKAECLAVEKRAEEARQARISELTREKTDLEAELPTLKGLFKGGRRKEVEARLAEIEAELKKL